MKKIFYCIFALTVFAGCYKDESSNRYDPIGAIEIKGVEENYSLITRNLITPADTLKISPEVTSTDPVDNVDGFEYLWTCYDNMSDLEAASTVTVIDTVAHTKDIVWEITLKPGEYTVKLRVTNPANGYAVYQTATLAVSTVFSNGFYFLKETAAGNTELDFHTPDGAGGWNTAFNLLETQLGASITGAPASLGMFPSYPYIKKQDGQPESGTVLIPMGGQDMKVMLLDDMSLVYDHNEIFFSGTAPNHKPLGAFYLSLFGISTLVVDNGAYAILTDSKTGKLGYPSAPSGGCSFGRGTMIGDDGSFFGGPPTPYVVFFDELNGQLVYYDYQGELLELSGDPSPFNITHRPLFIGSAGWCVFEEPSPPNRYLYLLNTDFFDTATQPIIEIRPIDAAVAPNFNSAKLYGSNKTHRQFLYGCIGDKVYLYNTGDDTERQLSLPGFGAGEVITMITHKRGVHNPTDRTDTAGYLFIATHKDGKYKVYMYKVTGGEPDGAPIIVEGTGKVVDMQYAGGTSNYENTLSDVY